MEKKLLFIISIFTFLFLFSACEKEYSCVCSNYSDGEHVSTTTYVLKGSKGEAKKECDNLSFENLPDNFTSICEIK